MILQHYHQCHSQLCLCGWSSAVYPRRDLSRSSAHSPPSLDCTFSMETGECLREPVLQGTRKALWSEEEAAGAGDRSLQVQGMYLGAEGAGMSGIE